MKVSVNILCLNTWDTTKDTLDILNKELEFTPHEIIIVDNGSTDGLKDIHGIKNGYIIRNKENLGISKGKNQGIRASKGEFIFMVDGDINPVPGSVLMLINYLETHPEVHALGFMPNKFTMEKNKHLMSNHETICHTLYNPRVHNCACLFYGIYRREIFDKVMMDEEGEFGNAGYGWEDHDFFNTMKKAGIDQWVCGLNSESGKYYHRINSSIRSNGKTWYDLTLKRRGEYYAKKWNDPVADRFVKTLC